MSRGSRKGRGGAPASTSRLVYGLHPVETFFEVRPADARRLYLAEGLRAPVAERLAIAAKAAGAEVHRRDRRQLDELARGGHQGVVLEAAAFPYLDLEDLLEAHPPGQRRILVLDGIQDPHNLGAIARVAVAFGWTGLVLRERRSVAVGPGACSASAGTIERCRIARVVNLERALEKLKDAGLWSYAGVLSTSASPPWAVDLKGDVALVMGAEGEGVSRLLRDRVDGHLLIPIDGAAESLSASTAAAILVYEIERQRAAS